jgi:hypothetical protein
VKEQEVQSKGVAARRGLKQPSTRQPVRNASEHDSARQVGEPASQGRNQVRSERNEWHSQSTVKDGQSNLSGGWWRNGSRSDGRLTRENHVGNETGVHSANRAKRADKEPGCVEVRASIVEQKRGNARGAKGRRKIERIRSAGRKNPPLVIGPLGTRSVQGGELCPAKGVQRNTLQPTLIRCWQAAAKGSQTPEKSKLAVAEPRASLVEVPRSYSACQSHRRPYRLESRMRENRLSGSEGGAILIPSSLPLSFSVSLRDICCRRPSRYRLVLRHDLQLKMKFIVNHVLP